MNLKKTFWEDCLIKQELEIKYAVHGEEDVDDVMKMVLMKIMTITN